MLRRLLLVSTLIILTVATGYAMGVYQLIPDTDKTVYMVDEPVQMIITNRSGSTYNFCNTCLMGMAFQVFNDYGGIELWGPIGCPLACDSTPDYPVKLRGGQQVTRVWQQHVPPGLYHFGVYGEPPYADFLVVARLKIDEAKSLPDGSLVNLVPAIVTFSGPDFFYIEDDARTIGIRIERPNHGLNVGDLVEIDGVIQTNDNMERFIAADNLVVMGTGNIEATPLPIPSLGGADWNYDETNGAGQKGVSGAKGTNNIGLLVSAQGTILGGAPSSTSFMMAESDGTPVEVVLPKDTPSPGFGSRVTVTGIVSFVKEHQQVTGPAAPTYKDFQRVRIQAKSVQVVLPASTWNYDGDMIDIPSGDFLMGNSGVTKDLDYDKLGKCENEKPQHTVYLSGYSIAKLPVTRGDYQKFMDAGGYTDSSQWSAEGWKWKTAQKRTQPDYWDAKQSFGTPPGSFTQTDDHPVIGVTFYEAEAYCKWAGGRLPTEAEWEKAARWDDGHPNVYPWGDNWDPQACKNLSDSLYPGNQTAPVGSYSAGASPYGCLDMAGNVWEWIKDWYGGDFYSNTPAGGWIAPMGPKVGTTRIVRGGSWQRANDLTARSAYRLGVVPNISARSDSGIGFRIAR